MVLNKLLNLFPLISREWIHPCFTGLKLLLKIYGMIPYLPCRHSLQLHLSKHLQSFVELLGYHCFYLSMVQFYLFLFFPIFLFICCPPNSFNLILLNLFLPLPSFPNFWTHFSFAHISFTYGWTSHHLHLPLFPIYFWVICL